MTLDLNGRVAVQAQAEPGTRPTELVLVRSRCDGEPIRLATNRRYLAQALEFAGPADAVCGRNSQRIYAWQPLSESAVIARPEHPLRIDSTSAPGASARQRRPRASAPAHGAKPPAPSRSNGRQRQPQPVEPKPKGLTSLVEEAQSLRTALGAARACTGRLLQALRFERRRSRQVETTLATLRQIGLPETDR